MVEFDTKLFVWAQLAEWCFPKTLAYSDPLTQAKFKGAYLNYYNTYFFGSLEEQKAGVRGWWSPDFAKKNDILSNIANGLRIIQYVLMARAFTVVFSVIPVRFLRVPQQISGIMLITPETGIWLGSAGDLSKSAIQIQ